MGKPKRDFSRVLEGIYVSDTRRFDGTGPDSPELELNASIAAAGVTGGDQAGIEVSAEGGAWTEVWTHNGGDIADAGWTDVT